MANLLALVRCSTFRRGGDPKKATAFFSFILDLLEVQPEMDSADIVRRTRAVGYAGGTKALQALIDRIHFSFALQLEGLLPGESRRRRPAAAPRRALARRAA